MKDTIIAVAFVVFLFAVAPWVFKGFGFYLDYLVWVIKA